MHGEMRVGNEVIETWAVWVSNCKSAWSNVARLLHNGGSSKAQVMMVKYDRNAEKIVKQESAITSNALLCPSKANVQFMLEALQWWVQKHSKKKWKVIQRDDR